MYKGLIRRCKIMILSSSIFVLLIGVAMLFFPGGNLVDKTSLHYNFFFNSLSDLGNSITITGKDNTGSKILYITAFGSLGLVMIYFSKIWWGMGTDVINMKVIGYVSKIFLIISGLGFIGIAFTPVSAFFEIHMIYFEIMLFAYSVWIILIMIIQNSNDKLRKLFMTNFFNLLIMIVYILIMLNYDKPKNEDDFQFYAFSQMIAILSIVVNLFIQSVGLMHFLKTTDYRRSGIRDFYV